MDVSLCILISNCKFIVECDLFCILRECVLIIISVSIGCSLALAFSTSLIHLLPFTLSPFTTLGSPLHHYFTCCILVVENRQPQQTYGSLFNWKRIE